MKKLILSAALMLLIATGCSGNAGIGSGDRNSNDSNRQQTESSPVNGEETPAPSEQPQLTEDTDDSAVADKFPVAESPQDAAAIVIAALKDKDLDTLKHYIHPEKGVLFAPYAYIEVDSALTFLPDQLPSMEDSVVRTWGAFDGSGEPIELTFAQYYERFVYDKDFENAETIGWNEIIGSGNSLPNYAEVFPGSYIVDYHFSGFDEQYAGMDWASLMLVLEEHNGGWYVSAIVHSQWTI